MQKITPQEKIIHDQFVQYSRNAKEWTRKYTLLLPAIEKYKIWQKKGFGSIHEYAGKLAGMSRYNVNEALRILKKVSDKPELMQVVEQKGIFAVKPLVTIITPETAKFWAEKARLMTKNTLETYVKEFRNQNGLLGAQAECENRSGQLQAQPECEKLNGLFEAKTNDFGRPGTSVENGQQAEIAGIKSGAPQKLFITMQLDPEIARHLEKLKGSGDWNALMKQLLQMRQEHLDEQKPEAIKTTSRHIPNKTKRYINARTNGQCAFPGCTKPAEIFQHTQRWALENIHDSDRLYGLCKEHERIAHLGLIENEEQSPQNWKIRAQPDTSDPKYKIDLVVQKFRNRHSTPS
jgi:hypothetical protein